MAVIFALFQRIFVYDVAVKQLLGLPRFQNLLLILYNHIKTICAIIQRLFANRQSRALFTWQKKQNFCKVSRSRFWAYRAQNLSGPTPNNILKSSPNFIKSVHFWRSYSQWTSLKRATKYFQYSAKLLRRVKTRKFSFERNIARVAWKLSQFFFFGNKPSWLEHVLF